MREVTETERRRQGSRLCRF
uniref:Uncharacterized protein n=1 Tax=Anguilla anguilla TaxID=7936 RepID=A0A0E9PXE3_ANGAN